MAYKDAYYFSHDANARNDQRLLAVRIKYGMRGYGIYFGIVEMLRESSGYQMLNDCSTIAYDLREDAQTIVDIVKNFNLFVIKGKIFYSQSLKDRMKEFDQKRITRSIAGRKGGLASSSKRQTNVNDCSSSKVKESKVNKIKVNKENTHARPSLGDLITFFKNNNLATSFFDYYSANGWKVGRNPMKDWKAAARNWERRQGEFSNKNTGSLLTKAQQQTQASYLRWKGKHENIGQKILSSRDVNTTVSLPASSV